MKSINNNNYNNNKIKYINKINKLVIIVFKMFLRTNHLFSNMMKSMNIKVI